MKLSVQALDVVFQVGLGRVTGGRDRYDLVLLILRLQLDLTR